MTSLSDKASHEDFFRKSGIFIMLNSMTNLMELAFNGVAARLPGGEYATFWALLRIFFIVTVPLTGVQLVVSKEVASYGALGQYGKRRQFLETTYFYAIISAIIITLSGLAVSPLIRDFLNTDKILPVCFIFIVILVYFPLPLLYGTIQGLKKFYTLSIVQSVWGFLRVSLTAVALFFLSGGINMFFFAITLATLLTVMVTIQPAKEVFAAQKEAVSREELFHGYRLIIPVIFMLFSVTMMKNADMVMAKHFFSDVNADAYACAALVGSAYFTISSIFMILFPMVSEESAKGGNPFIFCEKKHNIRVQPLNSGDDNSAGFSPRSLCM